MTENLLPIQESEMLTVPRQSVLSLSDLYQSALLLLERAVQRQQKDPLEDLRIAVNQDDQML